MLALLPTTWDLLHLLALLGLGLLLFVVVTTILVLRLLVLPRRKGYGWAVARGRPSEPGEANLPTSSVDEWIVCSRGVDLPVWSIRNEANPAGPTIVITYAWGESRVTALDWAEALYRHAGRIVLWDLPGHGEAGGWSTLGLREPADLRAVLGSLGTAAAERGDGAEQGEAGVILLGISMGGGIAIACGAELCTDRPPQSTRTDRLSTACPGTVPIAGVIAVGPPRRVIDAARRLVRQVGLPWLAGGWPAMRLLGLRLGRPGWFDRIEPARRLSAPLLVLTGSADVLCPPEVGRSLAEAAPRGRFVELPNIKHGAELQPDAPPAERVALAAIADFLDEVI
jgi:pimeloyl-ACP methyl ester carboxylesterase